MTGRPIEMIVEGPIATLVLNRPSKRNALSEAMWRDIADRSKFLLFAVLTIQHFQRARTLPNLIAFTIHQRRRMLIVTLWIPPMRRLPISANRQLP